MISFHNSSLTWLYVINLSHLCSYITLIYLSLTEKILIQFFISVKQILRLPNFIGKYIYVFIFQNEVCGIFLYILFWIQGNENIKITELIVQYWVEDKKKVLSEYVTLLRTLHNKTSLVLMQNLNKFCYINLVNYYVPLYSE